MVKDKVCRMTRRYGAGSYPTKQFLAGEARGRTAGPSFRHRPRALVLSCPWDQVNLTVVRYMDGEQSVSRSPWPWAAASGTSTYLGQLLPGQRCTCVSIGRWGGSHMKSSGLLRVLPCLPPNKQVFCFDSSTSSAPHVSTVLRIPYTDEICRCSVLTDE